MNRKNYAGASFAILVLLVMTQTGISQDNSAVMQQSTILEKSKIATYPLREGEKARISRERVYILGDGTKTQLGCYCATRGGQCSITAGEREVVCSEGPGEACVGQCKFRRIK